MNLIERRNYQKAKYNSIIGVLANLLIGEFDRITVKAKHERLQELCLRLQAVNEELTEEQELALFSVADAIHRAIGRKPPKKKIEIYASCFNYFLRKLDKKPFYSVGLLSRRKGEQLAEELEQIIEIQ